jgi:hypothetical protein
MSISIDNPLMRDKGRIKPDFFSSLREGINIIPVKAEEKLELSPIMHMTFEEGKGPCISLTNLD